jgi:flagellar protein FlgJ
MRVAPKAIEVPVEVTHATPTQMRSAIASAYTKLTGKPPSQGVLDALSAQAMLETARGTSMINYNFGGIKGTSPAGTTTRARTFEVEGGKTTHIVDHFRAYGSLEAGALDYVKLVRDRFGRALAAADAGSIDGFAHELKAAHYFTASEKDYASALHAMAGTPNHATSAPTLAANPTPEAADRFARAEEIARIGDALSASAARILAPSKDDD